MTEITVPIHPRDVAIHGPAAVVDAVAQVLAARSIPTHVPLKIIVTEKPISNPDQLDLAQAVNDLLHHRRPS